MLKLKSHFKSSVCFMAPDEGAGGGGAPSGGGSAPSAPASTPSGGASGATPSASPSGATPSPSPAPTPLAPSGPEPLGDNAFEGFGAEESDEPLPVIEVKPAVVDPKAPVVDPNAPPVAPQQPVQEAQPPVQPAQPQQPGPQEASQPQLPTPAEPARMGQAILSNLEDFANHLAASPDFQMSEADIEAFNTDITTALPKFAARVFLRAQASALNQMERVVPAIIQRYMKVSEAREKSQGAFYKRWPMIDQAKHGNIVNRMAQTYRGENPKASLEDMVEALGPYVLMAAKIPHQQGAAPNGNPQPHVASSPMRPVGNRPPASPFVPAVGGPASPPQVSEESPWMGFGAQEDE